MLLIIFNSAIFPYFLRFTRRYRFIHSLLRDYFYIAYDYYKQD